MKFPLAASCFVLAFGPAFAQEAPHPCESRDQGWKASFNRIEAAFQALPPELRVGRIPAAKLNAACVQYKSPKDFENCGVIVDRSVIAQAGLESDGRSWTRDGTTVAASVADPLFDEVCRLRDQRLKLRAQGPAPSADANAAAAAAAQKAAQDKTMALAKRVLAEANASGIGAPSVPDPPASASAPAPRSEPAPVLVNNHTCSTCGCWCALLPGACAGGDGGACSIVSSNAIGCGCQ